MVKLPGTSSPSSSVSSWSSSCVSLVLLEIVLPAFTASVSSTAVIASANPVTVMVKVAVLAFLSASSLTVYVNTSLAVSPGSRTSAAAWLAIYS